MAGSLQDTRSTCDASLLMSEKALAKRWGKSVRTLQRWRASGHGAPHILLGRSARYRLSDVLAFETKMLRGEERG
jgi:hypothetical protein